VRLDVLHQLPDSLCAFGTSGVPRGPEANGREGAHPHVGFFFFSCEDLGIPFFLSLLHFFLSLLPFFLDSFFHFLFLSFIFSLLLLFIFLLFLSIFPPPETTTSSTPTTRTAASRPSVLTTASSVVRPQRRLSLWKRSPISHSARASYRGGVASTRSLYRLQALAPKWP